MRRYCVVFCSVVLLQLVRPAPAAAWWDYLEQFSGPGPMWGWDIEGRLVCFARKQSPEYREALALHANAEAAHRSAMDAQNNLDLYLEAVKAFTAASEAWRRALPGAGGSTGPMDFVRNQAPETLTLPQAVTLALKAKSAADAAKELASQRQNVNATFFTTPVVGVIFSACQLKENETRRASLDIGMRFFATEGDSRYAGGRRINFTTFEPSFSWHLIDNEKLDFVDYGVGVGYYWFSSTEFPSFGGWFLEPARLDVHFPPGLLGKGALKWHPAIPLAYLQFVLFRVGQLVFPGGLETTRFGLRADDLDTPRRISRDWVRSYALFVDLELITKLVRDRK